MTFWDDMDLMDDQFLRQAIEICKSMLSDQSRPFCNPRDYTREQRWQDARDTMREAENILKTRRTSSE